MRICSVNVEWMNDWFTPDDEPPAFRPQFRRDGQLNDTATTAGRLAAMLKAIDADVIAIQEGPSRAAELALFVDSVPRRRVRVLPRRQRRPAEARAALPKRHVGGAHRARGPRDRLGGRRRRRRGPRSVSLHAHAAGRRPRRRRPAAAAGRRPHEVELHQHGPRAVGEPGDAAGVHRRGAHQPPPDLRRGHAHPPLPRPPPRRRPGRRRSSSSATSTTAPAWTTSRSAT